jgi:NAD(P)-dependent dehydrogenase (short-subunit alcohol dehydrogenase family)
MTDKPIALVTGANKGLGKEVVRQLGQRGMRVYLGSRDVGRGEEAVRGLAAHGLDIALVEMDVTDDASVQRVADEIGRRHGRLDVLVTNAGVLHRKATFETDAANMRLTYETNVFGVVRTIHTMLPLVVSAPQPRIVIIASTSASLGLASDPTTLFGQSDTILAYASSKAALTMIAIQYANAFRRSPMHAHIKVNAATPGHIATDLNNHAGTKTVEQGARIVLELATLVADGPSGGFFNDAGSLPW